MIDLMLKYLIFNLSVYVILLVVFVMLENIILLVFLFVLIMCVSLFFDMMLKLELRWVKILSMVIFELVFMV